MDYIKQFIDFILYIVNAIKYLVTSLKDPKPVTPPGTEEPSSAQA